MPILSLASLQENHGRGKNKPLLRYNLEESKEYRSSDARFTFSCGPPRPGAGLGCGDRVSLSFDSFSLGSHRKDVDTPAEFDQRPSIASASALDEFCWTSVKRTPEISLSS